MPQSERSSYTALDFLTWQETGALEITPKFQRRAVWKTPAKSYLIDTMLRGMPIPPIYLRITQNKERTRTIREVVDGQQRIRAVLEFVDGQFALSKSVSKDFGGKRFSQLPDDLQTDIRDYSFICESFKGISDEEVLEIFSRLNVYSVSLNKQELRNGKYFGHFKRSSYTLAHEHLEFWRKHKIFTEDRIARMLEVELTSEVMIVLLAGLQDKKASIDSFYVEYDESYPEDQKVQTKFRRVIDVIEEALGNNLKTSEFKRLPLFYTLCAVVAHRLFGVPKQTLNTPKTARLTEDERASLNSAVLDLSDKINAFKEDEAIAKGDLSFVNASNRQADNIKPRQIRFTTLYKRAFM